MIRIIRHGKYEMEDTENLKIFKETKIDKEGNKIEYVTKVLPRFSLYKDSNNLYYIENLINDLSKNDKYSLPVFLLRTQLIEYSLKYLLLKYPYKPNKGFDEKTINKLTIGQAIRKLSQLNDSHLDDIILEAENFVETRNKLTHKFLSSNYNIKEINESIKEKMKVALKIEKNILYFLAFVDETLLDDSGEIFY